MRNKLVAVSLLSLLSAVVVSAQSPQSGTQKVERGEFRLLFGNQGWLGIVPEEISSENAGKFGLNEARGVGITKIEKDSPAEKGGLQVNDVIIAIDGEKVGSVRKLTRILGEFSPDHKAGLTILRNGTEQEISVIIGKRNDFPVFSGIDRVPVPQLREFPTTQNFPEDFGRIERVPLGAIPEGRFAQLDNRQLGVVITTLTKQLGEHFGVQDGKGLLINDVRKDGAAEKAGLKAGDVILEVDGKSTASIGEFIREINSKKEGTVNLTILRDKQRQTVSLTLPKSKGQQILVERNFERENR